MGMTEHTIENRNWDYPEHTFHDGRTTINGTKFVVDTLQDRVILTWRTDDAKSAEHAELTLGEWDNLFDADNSNFMGYLVGAEPGDSTAYLNRFEALLNKLRLINDQHVVRSALLHLADACNEASVSGIGFPFDVTEALRHANDILGISQSGGGDRERRYRRKVS